MSEVAIPAVYGLLAERLRVLAWRIRDAGFNVPVRPSDGVNPGLLGLLLAIEFEPTDLP